MTKLARVRALIAKEFLVLFRDPKGWVTLIMPPLLQLAIFSFVATLEVKNIHIAILNLDTGKHATEIVERVSASSTVTKIAFPNNMDEITQLMDEQKIIAAITVPQNFSQHINRGQHAAVQIILDGRKSNAAQIVNGYLNEIINDYANEIRFNIDASSTSATSKPPTIVLPRNWFNENLIYLWLTVPSLVGILALLITVTVTALSVARERELGTFEQLLVSPLMPHEILIGKTVPAVVIGMLEGVMITVAAIIMFRIPFTGSFPLLMLALFAFVLSIVGVGLFISSLSKTQQQSVLGTFIFLVPAVALSGYASPVENMPQWMQTINVINPLKHFLVIVKGVFLKDMPPMDVWLNTYPVIIIGIVTMSVSGYFFAKKIA